MNKLIITFVSSLFILGCSPSITKEAAQITTHTQINKLLDKCERLGQVDIDYKTQMLLNEKENKIQARNELKQQAYNKFRADNLVYLSIHLVKGGYREDDFIKARGIAFRCDY